ncbi:MAG: ATP-binding protein [bacterium]
MEYKQYVSFINRQKDLAFLKNFIDKQPSELLFLHGPKSSGKTTLLYRFFDQVSKEEKLDIKFFNLRKLLLTNYRDFLQAFFEIDYSNNNKKEVKETREYDLKVFKLSVETIKGLENKTFDPFVVMERELEKLVKKGIKPVIIIDELQALDGIYFNGGRRLITEIFNFFVAMTKESHLAHIIISSSDGYFLETVYTDSRLKKTSEFYEINYLSQEDTLEWLLNLDKYSRIKDYRLNKEEALKIWETVGGSMWEIQALLSKLFSRPLEEVLEEYKHKMLAIFDDYIGFNVAKTEILRFFIEQRKRSRRDLVSLVTQFSEEKVEALLKDLVKNNILYYDPTLAIFYPQGRSLEWGIRLYFTEEV